MNNNRRIMETNKYKINTNVKTRPGLNFIRWNQIDWIEVNVIVNRLQRKIYKTANGTVNHARVTRSCMRRESHVQF